MSYYLNKTFYAIFAREIKTWWNFFSNLNAERRDTRHIRGAGQQFVSGRLRTGPESSDATSRRAQ